MQNLKKIEEWKQNDSDDDKTNKNKNYITHQQYSGIFFIVSSYLACIVLNGKQSTTQIDLRTLYTIITKIITNTTKLIVTILLLYCIVLYFL